MFFKSSKAFSVSLMKKWISTKTGSWYNWYTTYNWKGLKQGNSWVWTKNHSMTINFQLNTARCFQSYTFNTISNKHSIRPFENNTIRKIQSDTFNTKSSQKLSIRYFEHNANSSMLQSQRNWFELLHINRAKQTI